MTRNMDNPSCHILINRDAGERSSRVTGLLERAGLKLRVQEFQGDHLPDEVPGSETHDLILLFTDASGQTCETLLRQLQTARRDIPCLLICRSPSRWLPMLSLGAAGLVSESQLETASGQVQFVYQVKRELEQLRLRREGRRAAGSVRELYQRLQLFIDNSSDAVATLQNGLHQSANPAWLAFFGFRSLPDVFAVPFLDLVADEDAEKVRSFLQQPFNNGIQRCEFTAIRRDGSEVVAALDGAAVSINGAQSLQLMVQTAQGNASHDNAVRNALNQDLQSGLLNETGFERALNQAISSAVYQGNSSALILLTAPQLAEILVVLGKTDGHLLMRDIASVLQAKCPPQSVIGRLDDGDFALLLPDADSEACLTLLSRLDCLETALQSMAPAGMSLAFHSGAAMISDEAPDAETLLVRARQHQTVRRHSARGAQPDEVLSSGAQALLALRQAMQDQNLLLVYQPTVSLRSDEREHYEVRIRVPVADRLIYPEEFLQAAIQHGYGERLDRYVISHAMRTISEQDNARLHLTVNLTANTLLSKTFPAWLSQELKRQDQSPARLILQINELDILSAPTETQTLCQILSSMGFELAIARFGCSLDPFRLLGMVSAEYVKLDRSLLQHIDLDSQQRERLHEVVSHLQAQGIRIIAPLIEDIELLPLLWQANINYVQGNCLRQPSEQLETGLFREQEISLPQPCQHSETL